MTVHAPIQALQPGFYKLRDADFDLLDRSGAFRDHAKTELLDGEIYYMNAQHRPHGHVKMRLYDALSPALRSIDSPLSVVVEFSVALSEHDVPEPDLTLTTEPEGRGVIPGSSVALLIEVSDTTLDEDLGRKQAIYARAGVPEYWVADVNGRVIHRMWSPVGDGGYSQRDTVDFGQPINAATIEGLTIDTEKV